jgi:excisionase family DNA binding protein
LDKSKTNPRQRRHPEHSEPSTTTQDLVMRRKLWPVAEAAYQLGMHRVTLYRLMKAGEVRFVKVNNRTYVTDAELDRFVARAEVTSA